MKIKKINHMNIFHMKFSQITVYVTIYVAIASDKWL